MLKTTSLAIAALVTSSILFAIPASAIDKGPCDHCTMEPIVVKGDRKKTETSGQNTQTVQPSSFVVKTQR